MSRSFQVAGEVEPGRPTREGRLTGALSRRQRFALVLLVALAALAARPRFAASIDLSGDEAEYRRLAGQLATHGVLSDHRLEATPGPPTAFREPVYPIVLGAAAQLERGADPSGGPREVLSPAGAARRTLLLVQWLLLLAAALTAAGWAVATTESTAVGGAAAVAIATSPALVQASASISTEAIAAPLALFAAVALARTVRAPSLSGLVAAAASFGLLATTRLAYLLLWPLAMGLVAAAWPAGRRGRALLLFGGISLLPAGIWSARNLLALGAPTLDEGRGAFNLLVRAELDRQLRNPETPEARAALLAWIPPAWGVTRARERFPGAAILRPSRRNRDYYFTRALAIWQAEVERGGSRLRAAPQIRRQAIATFTADPAHHLFVSALVGWRTLFAERGALAIADTDLALVTGLALHLLLLGWTARALRRRDLPALALALIPLCGWVLHALLTEGRDRFQVPALPVLWLLAALAAGEAVRRLRPPAESALAAPARIPYPCPSRFPGTRLTRPRTTGAARWPLVRIPPDWRTLMRTSCLFPAILAMALALPAGAESAPAVRSTSGDLALPSPRLDTFDTEAAAIIQYDDGEVDTSIGGTSTVSTFELAMRFDGIGGTDVTLGGVDVCMRQFGSDPKIRYEVVVWAADGAGGTPGTELAHYAAVAEGVTSTPSFHSTNFTYPLTTPTVYLGVRYAPAADPDFQFCLDNDGATVHPGYYRLQESGAWNGLPTVVPAYNALMLRAYIYTPGVFVESLLVPSYLVDTLDPSGTTTLFAVRNLTADTVNAEIDYFDVLGGSLRTDSITLDPRETHTVNVRDVAGLPADFDGHARGFIEISTAGDPHQVPVLGGDFFQVDVADNFATGDKLARRSTDVCDEGSIRFLNFPFAGSGTRLTVWIANPLGSGLGDPPSFFVRVYDEAGNLQGAPIGVVTANHALQLDAATFTGALPFGVLRFDFSDAFGGVAYTEAQAGGRFSVGMTGQCHEAP